MIQILGDRVLVALPPEPDEIVSAGGIVLARDPDRLLAPTRGLVVALGEKTGTVDLDEVMSAIEDVPFDWSDRDDDIVAAIKALGPAPFDVQLGDCVLFPRSAGEELELEGIRYVILREAELIGIVEPNAGAM